MFFTPNQIKSKMQTSIALFSSLKLTYVHLGWIPNCSVCGCVYAHLTHSHICYPFRTCFYNLEYTVCKWNWKTMNNCGITK